MLKLLPIDELGRGFRRKPEGGTVELREEIGLVDGHFGLDGKFESPFILSFCRRIRVIVIEEVVSFDDQLFLRELSFLS